jgi:MraZ protein
MTDAQDKNEPKSRSPRWCGQFPRQLDGKHRLPIPPEWRGALDDLDISRFVLAPSPLMDCIRMYPKKDWDAIADKVEALAESNVIALAYRRSVVGNAHMVKIDGASRVLLPPALRDLFKLGSSVVMVGQLRYIEIWRAEVWAAEMKKLTAAAVPNFGQLAELGL